MIIPAGKWGHVHGTQDLVKQYEQQYSDGLITKGEKYNKVVDAWQQCSDKVAEEMMQAIQAVQQTKRPDGRYQQPNAIWMMAHSGARGSAAQIKQLAGMRGLMAKPSGEIIENPIISNFKEGLTVLEYFNSTHGARKGLADTALEDRELGLPDPPSGRRGAGLHHHRRGLRHASGRSPISTSGGNEDLGERILGRTVAEDIVHPRTGEVLAPRNTLLDEELCRRIDQSGVDSVHVRSVLTCDSKIGVCGRCYGRDLARGTHGQHRRGGGRHRRPVDRRAGHAADHAHLPHRRCGAGLGRAVGDREPVRRRGAPGQPAPGRATAWTARSSSAATPRSWSTTRSAARSCARSCPTAPGCGSSPTRRSSKGQVLAEWDPHTLPVITEASGTIVFHDLIDGTSFREVVDEATGQDQQGGHRLAPERPLGQSAAVDRCCRTSTATRSRCRRAARRATTCRSAPSCRSRTALKVHAGDVLARLPREASKTRDITGGLPRVAELFEARRPKDPAIIAEIEGRIEFGKDYKNKRRLRILPADEDLEPVEYLIPKGRHVVVQEGDVVKPGDLIVDGNPVPHDLLRVLGVEALAQFLVNEIQEVYKLQGVKINDKHIEVIVRQMLQKIEIIDPGDTTFLVGEQVDRLEFDQINDRMIAEDRRPATCHPVLQGITKASLQTQSFISAASFQETTRVLTDAAFAGKVDKLQGLKENVIVGRLIPAGTGGVLQRLQEGGRHRRVVRGTAARAAAGDMPLRLPEMSGAAVGIGRTLNAAAGRDRLSGLRHFPRNRLTMRVPAGRSRFALLVVLVVTLADQTQHRLYGDRRWSASNRS